VIVRRQSARQARSSRQPHQHRQLGHQRAARPGAHPCCLRQRYPASYAKGAHLLPPELTVPLEAALVTSLDEAGLRRALGAAIAALAAEIERTDPVLAIRLNPMLTELSAPP
jgi:hypothetical protein